MSWEEYKKKRQESTNTEKANNNELSSWEKYKQQRENEITVSSNEIKKENKTFWQEMKDRTEKRLQESRNNREKTTKNQIKNSISNIKNSMSNQEETLPRATEKNIINSISKISKQGGLNNYMEGKTLNEVSDVDEILKESISNIKNGNVVKASSAFEDGYQFGDVTKTVLSTGADTALNVGKGIMNIGEGIGDLVTYGIAGVADLTGNDEYANRIRYNASHRNVVDEIMSPIIEKVDKNSVFGDKIDEINQGLGYIAGNTAISYLTGGVGNALGLAPKGVKVAQTAGSMATTFSSSMGHGMTEAYQGGATDDEAFAYGLVSALGETGSELMFGGLGKATEAIGLSKGALDDAVIGGLTKNIKDKMAKTLMQSGLKAGGEGAEEVVSGFVSAIGKKLTYMSEEDLKEIIKNENLAEQFWMGTLTSAIAQSRSTMASVKNGTDYITGKKYNDIAKNNTSELTQNVQNNEGSFSKNNIANNQEEVYNNNESESGINENSRGIEQDDKRRVQELFKEYQRRQNNGATNSQELRGNQIQQNVTENTIKQGLINYADKYQKNNLTEKENKLKNIINKLGGDVIFYEYGNENFYQGLANNEKFYIDTLGESSVENVFYHELTHYLRQNNNKIYNNEIQPIVNEIASDYNYQEAIFNYANSSEDFDVRKLVANRQMELAEEVVADYVASFYGDLQVDYGLPVEMEQQIRSAMDKILNVNDTLQYQNVAPSAENNVLDTGEYTKQKNKILNPTEIANLNMQDANTTPKLKQKNYAKGNKQSSFLSNIVTDAKFLNEDLRQEMSKEDNIKYYKGITNKGTLESAYKKLQENGQSEAIRWHSKDSKKATAEDVAEGWILLKQYQDNGDYQSAVEVAKKMRDIGTTAGQTVQAYNILSRLTPEGMFYYAQSELDEAYNRMVEGKSKKWIEKNQSNFNLTPEETQSILDIMKDVSTMEDGYNKKVKIAEIQKMITDKIPPTAGQSIKAWMRISMLFNPKTQVRNVMGNAVIMPVNMFSDSVSAGIDKLISKKTGVRTIGNTNLKNYGKGFGTGLYQSYNDFKKGINTRNIEGNRFEVSEGKNFKNKGIGKALNRVDNLLSFMLDAGDRGFYEATFTNSINNQMILNNVTTPTQEMIDIATNEALQRTWQDNNNYTQSVLKIRNILNNVNIKGYGLGDVIIPFAKTPANLTKAIIDYSPAGLVKTLATDARKLKNSLENGQYTAQTQHRFVQNLGKGMAGSFLYVISYALAEAGIATGEADEDKDVKNFIKNSLGINSYSIKIGDKTFSYDWAQPIATPLAIMTNYVKYSKENPDANALEKGINAMNIGTEQLLQQSFMDSLNTVLNGSGTTLENLSQAILELPARAIPTFSKQIADMVDVTQRTTFEYDKPIQSAINSVKAKIPGLSKTLPASVDTLGNEIQKYGGNNNLWNVMFNPANTNKGQLSKAGEEIYNIYKETGDKTIFPRTAPYYINNNNEKVSMTAEQRSRFQTISGKYVENSLNSLLSDKEYKKLSSEEKANIINEIVSDSYLKAKYDVLKIDSKEYEKLRSVLKNVSSASYYSYKFKTKEMKKDSEKIEVLVNSNYNNKEKTALYEQYILSSTDKKYPIIKEAGIDINQYLKYKQQEFTSDKEDDGTLEGKTISGSKKEKVWNYIEGMNLSYTKKLILYSLEYTPSDSQKQQIVNYIESLPGKTKQEKLDILSQFKGFTIYKDGTFKY